MLNDDGNSIKGNEKTNDTSSVRYWMNRSYLYQNRATGAPSTTALSASQLCRVLSPSVPGMSSSLGADSYVLGLNGHEYDRDGWKMVKDIPILRESSEKWYFCENGKVDGPVSCRELATLMKQGTLSMESKVHTSTRDSSIGEKNKSTSDPCWSPIHDLVYLQAAMRAFDVQSLMQQDSKNENAQSNIDAESKIKELDIQSELQAFLLSTGAEADEEETYESDGGTVYAKCPQTGKWIHADLIKAQTTASETTEPKNQNDKVKHKVNNASKGKKRKRPKFSARNAKCWIYITGLPSDCTEDEVASFFSRVGILDLNPSTQEPKVKLYKNENGKMKGDASVCYARAESVGLAVQILDQTPFRVDSRKNEAQFIVSVQQAKFEQHGDTFEAKPGTGISNAQRKVAKLAALQARDWDEDGDNGRISGGRKGLRIIVLKGMYDLRNVVGETKQDKMMATVEQEIRTKSQQEEWGGDIEKITFFSKHPDGVVIVKFSQPAAASAAIKAYNGVKRDQRQIKAHFWDGVTDFTIRDEAREREESKKRQDEFGEWLESQEVPEEFMLQVEGH